MELAQGGSTTVVGQDVTVERIRKGPGVYLRMRQAQAVSPRSINDAASRSLRDGFTSCLFERKEDTTGEPCTKPADCPAGKLCNDWGVCGTPSQPYNMRLAYRALRILSPEWTDELHRADSEIAVRAFELDLEAVSRTDVPVAVEVLSRAKLFTVVLDEDPIAGLPPPAETAPQDPKETDEERLQRVPHRARVGIWDLRSDALLVRVSTDASGEFVPVGDQVIARQETRFAQQRQVNSCAIALSVKDVIEANAAPEAPSSEKSGAPAVPVQPSPGAP
jgi:hypothetical protein